MPSRRKIYESRGERYPERYYKVNWTFLPPRVRERYPEPLVYLIMYVLYIKSLEKSIVTFVISFL